MPRRRNQRSVRRGEHFGVGQAGRIIGRHVEILPADVAGAPPPIAVHAMLNPHDATEAFEIDVQEVADVWPLVPLHGRRRLEKGESIQTGAIQHPCHRRARDAQRRADLPGGRTGPSQRHDRRFARRRESPRLAVRPRRLVGEPVRLPRSGDPLRDRPDANPEGGGNPRIGPALSGSGHDQLAHF